MIKRSLPAWFAASLLLASAFAQSDEPAEDTATAVLERAPQDVWERVDPENILVLDLPSGTLLIEMREDYAPNHVGRVRTLAREGFYNGTIFHRVIDGFMAQGGDPTGTGQGGSDYPDLEGRFARSLAEVPRFVPIGRDDQVAHLGFLGTLPMASQPPSMMEFLKTDEVAAWPLHCPNVVSMARAGDPNSANSQFFILFADRRRNLDKQYTAFGRVIDGFVNVRRINRGEPPERPTPVLRARIMADLPPEERKTVEVLRPESETFKAWLQKTGAITDDGFFVDACSVNVPTRIGGEISEWALLN